MSPLAALIIDWVVTALWPIIGAYGVVHFSGPLFSTAGLCVGVLLMAPWLLRAGRWRAMFERRTGPTLAAMGFLSGLATTIYISALDYTTPANAAIMAQVEVLYSALLCAYFLGERVTAAQGAATALIMAGTGMVMLHDLSSPRWKGDLMVLATPWLFQVSHMLSKRLPAGLDAVSLSGGRAVYGIVTMLPVCAWVLARGARWSWSGEAMLILGLQGALMSSLNFVLWYVAIRGMDLSKATAIMLSYPALTVLFSWALGRERIGALQVAGLVVTMAGAYWMSRLVVAARAGLQAETPGTDLIP